MRLIRKKHRNSLLELIRSANLDVQAFRPSEEITEKNESFRLDFLDSPYYFIVTAYLRGNERKFSITGTQFQLAYPDPIINQFGPTGWIDFEGSGDIFDYSVKTQFNGWLSALTKYLDYLKEEEEERLLPDLWSELGLPNSSSHGSFMLQNTPFSTKEQARITESFQEFLEELKRRDILTTEQFNLLQEQVDYLVESSRRLGRKDWLAAAVGALMGATLSSGLTTSAAVQVINLAGEALRWIAQTPLLLPQYRGF